MLFILLYSYLLYQEIPRITPKEIIDIKLDEYTINRDMYLHKLADSLRINITDFSEREEQNLLSKDEYDAQEYVNFPDYDMYSLHYPGDCSWYCAGGALGKSASSTLPGNNNQSYDIYNVTDGRLNTAWVEGSAGYGEGEKLNIEVTGTSIDRITIYSGYQKSEKLFRLNSRPKELLLSINDSAIAILELENVIGGQTFKFNKHKLKDNEKCTVTLWIMQVYKGEKYSDTAISDVIFDGPDHH